MSASRELADLVSESPSTDLNLDNNTLFVDVSENRVGIGTTTPGFTLDVQGTLTVGVDDTGYDVKFFGATSGKYMLWDESADSLIIDGKVGIGTTAPSEKLQVKGTVGFETTDSTNRWVVYAHTDDTLRFNYNGAGDDEIVVDSAGRVGIGTTSPQSFLQVNGTSSGAGEISITRVDTSQTLVSGSALGYIFFGAQDADSTLDKDASQIVSHCEEAWTSSAHGSRLQFFTTTSGTTTAVERMRIDNAGKVGIGTTSPSTPLHIYKSGLADASTNALLTIDGKFAPNSIDSDDGVGIAFRLENGLGGSQTTTCIASTFQPSYNALVLQSAGGNVGIGTTAPTNHLHIRATASGIGNLLRLENPSTTADHGAKILFTAGTSSDGAGIGSGGQAINSADLRFYSGGNNERMRIDANGRIVTNTNPLIIGSTSVNSSYASGGSAISNALLLERSTSPPDATQVGNAANNTQAYLYSKQSAGTAGVYVMDSNGNETQISTHTRDDEKDYEIFDSSIINGKKRHRRINVIKLTRALEKLTGEKFLREWYD